MVPTGCWSSEGGLSKPVLELLEEEGFQWTAGGDSVLYNSLVKNVDANSGGEQSSEDHNARPHAAVRFGDNTLSGSRRGFLLSPSLKQQHTATPPTRTNNNTQASPRPRSPTDRAAGSDGARQRATASPTV